MRRIIGAVLALGIVIICLTARADTYRKGQDPFAGYAAMYCSTLHGLALHEENVVNAPEGYKIARFDIWGLDTLSLRMVLKFFYTNCVGADTLLSTIVDVNTYSGAGTAAESQWYWKFPVTCERIRLTSETALGDADWGACVYLMRYGEGAGIADVLHPWHLEP